jgi:hypothetical protein
MGTGRSDGGDTRPSPGEGSHELPPPPSPFSWEGSAEMSIPDFDRFIRSSVELLEPYARKYSTEEVPEDPEVAAEHMAVLGAWTNLLALKIWLDNGFVEIVDGKQVAALRTMKQALRESGL